MTEADPAGFLDAELLSLVKDTEKTVTAALAIDASVPVHKAAEHVFHHHARLSSEEDMAGSKHRIRRFLNKIIPKDTSTAAKDSYEDDSDQWQAIRPLSESERREVHGLGRWGTATPSNLFTDVCLVSER